MTAIIRRNAVAAIAALPLLLAGAAAEAADAVCSGIGEEAQSEEASIPHSLKLVYANPEGKYLGEVSTRIEGEGVSLAITCPGPWVLADLPAGGYTVTATFEGESKSLELSIGEGLTERTVTF